MSGALQHGSQPAGGCVLRRPGAAGVGRRWSKTSGWPATPTACGWSAPELARRIVPGQFLMLRLAGGNDPLLGRPLALYDTWLRRRRHAARRRRRLPGRRPDDVATGRGEGRRRDRSLGPARQRLFDRAGRSPDHGRRRHRPDAVSGPGPRSARRPRLRRRRPADRCERSGRRSATACAPSICWPASTTSARRASTSASAATTAASAATAS